MGVCRTLQETRSIDVILVLEKQSVDFGFPQRLISDNGPQYGSFEFREFAKRLNFEHVTSSPSYARSNGQSERSVQTVKNSLIKMLSDGKTLAETLIALRSTPVGSGLPSPAVLLQGRHLRSGLHCHSESLTPKVVSPNNQQSYWVRLTNGYVVRRNRTQINTTREEGLQTNSRVGRNEPNRAIVSTRVAEPNRAIVSTRVAEPNRAIVSNRVAEPNRAIVSNRVAEPNRAIVSNRVAEPNRAIVSNRVAEPNRAIVSTRVAEPNRAIVSTRVAEPTRANQPARAAGPSTSTERVSKSVTTRSGRVVHKPSRYLE